LNNNNINNADDDGDDDDDDDLFDINTVCNDNDDYDKMNIYI
jgi:hypothetical protein